MTLKHSSRALQLSLPFKEVHHFIEIRWKVRKGKDPHGNYQRHILAAQHKIIRGGGGRTNHKLSINFGPTGL